MIPIEELMIGNLFEWSYIASMGFGLSYVTYDNIGYHNFMEPILITPEWLIKLGFEKKPDLEWKGNGADYQPETSKTRSSDYVLRTDSFIYRIETYSWRKDIDCDWDNEMSNHVYRSEWYAGTCEGQIRVTELKYVHQLQNIYKVLTGNPLPIR